MPATASLNAPTKYAVAPLVKKTRHMPFAGSADRSLTRSVKAIRATPSGWAGSAIRTSVMSCAGVPTTVGTLPVPVSPEGSVTTLTPGSRHEFVAAAAGIAVVITDGDDHCRPGELCTSTAAATLVNRQKLATRPRLCRRAVEAKLITNVVPNISGISFVVYWPITFVKSPFAYYRSPFSLVRIENISSQAEPFQPAWLFRNALVSSTLRASQLLAW